MKKIFSLFVIMVVVLFNGFMLFEGQIAGAATYTADWIVALNVTNASSFMCGHGMTTSTELNMGSIPGLTGGDSIASTYCLVKTNNDLGWDLYLTDGDGTNGIMTDDSPNIIDAYPTTTPSVWVLDSTSSAYYGYSSVSPHSLGGHTSLDLYSGLTNTTTDPSALIAGNSDQTSAAGERTDINFQVQIGSGANQPSGIYRSHVMATLVER